MHRNDGDAMNCVISSGTATRNEISELSAVSNWFISHTTSSPIMGQVDDSVIGCAELTRSNIMYDKYHAMLLFQSTTFLPSFDEMNAIGNNQQTQLSGRDLMSKLLEATPINFQRMTEWYTPAMAPFIKYDPTEIKVIIDQGKLVQGVLDKKSIGKGSNGGIYHLIANEYGADKALEVMFNMQQLAIGHTYQQGFSIGIMDLLVSEQSKRDIDNIAADIINKSNLITEELNNGEIIPPIGKTVEQYFEDRQINTLSIFDDFTEVILAAINPDTNNLFKLIKFGSKGKLEHMFNMVSAVGQKLINGDRIKQKFGYKRSLAYFPRFDTSPASRGYITNSYLAGMTSSEYVFNAMAARFDLITKALSTSVTGEQNRKSIKNLESIVVNNFRWAVKNQNIVQLVYGDDFLDPRRVERIKFPTVMISNAQFDATYHHPDFDDEFNIMAADRDKYRNIFMKIESCNVKELMSDERKMPVDVDRIIKDIIRAHLTTDSKAVKSNPKVANPKDLNAMVDDVTNLCDGIPYVILNAFQAAANTEVPKHIAAATWLLTMLIRSYLHPNALVALMNIGFNSVHLGLCIDKIRLRFAQALIEPGTAVGIIAAQSFSEPLTQYMLDAHHRSVSGGTSKSPMVTAKEILGARPVDRLANPGMLIPVLPEYAESKSKVQEIANNIEVMKFRQFVTVWQIFFEKFGEPRHSKYLHESAHIAGFLKLNPLCTPPGDLTKWCIRFAINKTTLILKNMSLELIITRLREVFPDTFIVSTPENSQQVVIRCYMRSVMFKGVITTPLVKTICVELLDTIIRGVEGITNTTVVKMLRNKINDDGSCSRNENLWGITTNGTNMRGIFGNRYVDKYKTITDSIQETATMFGIEAALQKAAGELRNLVDVCNHRHYLIYANEMCFTGRVTSIESGGLKTRESSNVLLRIGFSAPMATLEEAALNSMEDTVTGVTAPLLIGTVPKYGTLYNAFYVNRDFVEKNVKKPDDLIEALFD